MSFLGLDLSRNVSYFTVPVAFVLAFAPHTYAVISGGRKNFVNYKPREFQSRIADDQALDAAAKARILRAEGASANGFESLGYFAAAVVAANHAGVPAADLNALSLGYLLARTFYIYAYIALSTSRPGAGWRSAAWFVCIGLPSALFVKAGLRSM
jgi:uncharacterized MAPEG superfamily protein